MKLTTICQINLNLNNLECMCGSVFENRTYFTNMILILIFILFSSCASSSRIIFDESNTRDVIISFQNNSPYAVEVLLDNPDSIYTELHLESKETKEKIYIISKSDERSFFFYPRFLISVEDEFIPFTDKEVVFRIETKNSLEQVVTFHLPEKSEVQKKDSYIILRNASKSEISIMNSSSRQIYLTINKTKSIPKGSSGVFSSSDRDFISNEFVKMLVKEGKKETALPINFISPGFVYTYEYDGNSAMLTDSRPLLAMGEETWEATFAENISVCKMFRKPDSDALYFAGTETALDAKGFPFLRGVAGRIEISNSGAESALDEFRFAPFDVEGDVQFLDAVLLNHGEFVAAGQVSAQEPRGIIVRYTADGAVSDFAVAEETVALGALCRGADGSSFFAGGINFDGNIIIMSVSCGASLECKKIASLSIPSDETVDGIKMCYSATEKFILIAVNIKDADGFPHSHLYKIPCFASSDTTTEINLQGKICMISSIAMNQNGDVFLAGEASVGAKTTACVLTVHLDKHSCETQFISPEAPSWISGAWLDETAGELIVCGMTTSGKNRVPFMRAFSVQDLQTLWEQTYSAPAFKGLNDAAFLIPCADYGFLVGMSALDADNRHRAPFKIVRVTSTGKISKNHRTIQLKGEFDL